MKKFFPVIVLAAIVIMAGCSSVTVKHDYDRTVDFKLYKTFAWLDVKVPEDELIQNPLARKRAIEAIDKELQNKGFEKTDKGADFGVIIHGRSKEQMQITDWGGYGAGYGYGYRPWWGPYGGTTDVSYYEVGALVVDIVDLKTKELVWRGMATKTIGDKPLTPEQWDGIAARVLANFPPVEQ